MARINTYTQDQSLSKADKFLGSDSSGSTRNFSIQSVSDFFKNTNSGGVISQFVWQYKNATPISGNLQAIFSSGSTFANLTSLQVSKYTKSESTNSIENLLTSVIGKDIILVETIDKDNYGIFNVVNISVINDGSGNPTDNYTISLSYQNKGNGSLVIDKHYAFAVFGGGADKTSELVFTSSSFASSGGSLLTETINGSSMPYVVFNHNLGKKPSISVEQEGSPGQVAMMPVKYINNNTVRVYFTGTTSGKIYAN
tara:strand:+ start:750 stop:1514 length:765 start_codon:yes stop_codon:yes gene_type:complete